DPHVARIIRRDRLRHVTCGAIRRVWEDRCGVTSCLIELGEGGAACINIDPPDIARDVYGNWTTGFLLWCQGSRRDERAAAVVMEHAITAGSTECDPHVIVCVDRNASRKIDLRRRYYILNALRTHLNDGAQPVVDRGFADGSCNPDVALTVDGQPCG